MTARMTQRVAVHGGDSWGGPRLNYRLHAGGPHLASVSSRVDVG